MGLLRNGPLIDIYAANEAQISKVSHDLEGKEFFVRYGGRPIRDLKGQFSYAAGGPVLRQGDGSICLMYHAEKNSGRPRQSFYSELGVARSADEGSTFQDLGIVITPNAGEETAARVSEIGGGSLFAQSGVTRAYFRDLGQDGKVNGLTFAQTLGPLGPGNWKKYFNGSCTEAGVGGRSTGLGSSSIQPLWLSIASCPAAELVAMAYCQRRLGRVGVYLCWSADGTSWSRPEPIETDIEEAYYPSLVGIGEDPSTLGGSFFVYYTVSSIGGFSRWADAALARRQVRLST